MDSRVSTYSLPNDDWFFSNPKTYYENGLVWKWPQDETDSILFDENEEEVITKEKFIEFLRRNVYVPQ